MHRSTYIILRDRRWFPGAYDSHRVGLPNKRNSWPGEASIYRRLASAMTKVGDLVRTGHLRTYSRNNDSSLLMSRYLGRWRTIINSSVLIILFLYFDQTRLSRSYKRFYARFLWGTRIILSRIHIIARLLRSSHRGVLSSASFRVIWAKGLGKQTVSEPVARDHHAYFCYGLETKRSTIAEVVSARIYSRDTRVG